MSKEGKQSFMDVFKVWDKEGRWVVIAMFFCMVVDGLDIQVLSLALPSIIKEQNISLTAAGAIATYTLAGMGIGGLFGGWMADRLGRRKIVLWSIISFSILTGLIGLAHTYWQICALRFLAGLGMGSIYGVGSLLAAEYVPTQIRTTVLGSMQAGWSFGYVVAGILSSFLIMSYGWRSMFVIAIFPGLLVAWMLKDVKEPATWLASRKAALTQGKKENQFKTLVKDKKIFRTLLLWMATSIFLMGGYYGIVTWIPAYIVKDLGVNLKAMGWYTSASYVMMMAGKVVAGICADKWGRRPMWVVFGVLTAITLPAVAYYASPANAVYLLLIVGFMFGSPYGIFGAYVNESYPTRVRGTAMAISHNAGRVGATLGPLALGLVATHFSIGYGIAVVGAAYLLCAIIPGLFIAEKMYDTMSIESTPADVESATAK